MRAVRTGFAFLATLQWVLAPAWSARAIDEVGTRANVIGSVATESGEAVAEAKIDLVDPASGRVVASDVSDASGSYRIECAAVGDYRLRMNPPSDRYWGMSVVMPLGPEGAQVDWKLAMGRPSLVTASATGGACSAEELAEGDALAEAVAGSEPTGKADPSQESFLKRYWPWLVGGTATTALIVGLVAAGGGGSGGGSGGGPQSPTQ